MVNRAILCTAAMALAAAVAASCGHEASDGERTAPQAPREASRPAAPIPSRIVSVVPSATQILFAIGAGHRVVAVSSFDRHPPEVARLPRVGGLLDPDLERIITLRPDLVIVFATQDDVRAQLEHAGLGVFPYRHGGLEDVLATIRALGSTAGVPAEAERLASSIARRLDAVRQQAGSRRRPRTLLVIEREPGSFRNLYASGGTGFLNDMLEAAGGRNVFEAIERQAVQVTTEAVLAAAPEVIIELRPDALGLVDQSDTEAWSALSAIPAVANGRVHQLIGDQFVVPGPRVADAVERMAEVLSTGTAGPR